MKPWKIPPYWYALMPAVLILHLYSRFDQLVENQYSQSFFPVMATGLRSIWGRVPFSIGDILYGLAFLWLLFALIRRIRSAYLKKPRTGIVWQKLVTLFAIIYLIFNILWGINYNRLGIAHQLGLKPEPYAKGDLYILNDLLVNAVNEEKSASISQNRPLSDSRAVLEAVLMSYDSAQIRYPFLDYRPASIKSSLWGWLGNYTGFTGYYNPFTGEAQVNTSIPRFLQPFVGCHEIAHQLGYARENEANFVGYLAARASGNPEIRYSAVLDVFMYANRSLYAADSTSARNFRKRLSVPVQDDLKTWAKFQRDHESFIEPVIHWLYGKYLERNRQPAGIRSYDEVTVLLWAYYKKFGKI